MIKKSSKCQLKSSEIHKVAKFSPWSKFENLATSVPAFSENDINGPPKKYFKKSQKGSSKNSEKSTITLERHFGYYTNLVPKISEITPLVLMILLL
jgi:hypothetical protein